MHLSLPQSGHNHQVRLTISHPEWQTTAVLDDSHKTFELTPPEGIDINDVEVVAEFLDVLGQPASDFSPIPVKEKHVKPVKDEGKSGEPDANESAVTEQADNADAGVASVEASGDGTAEPVGEASDEQAVNEAVSEVVSEVALDEAAEVVVQHAAGAHHKARRPRHA
jgi:hypothetical protein